MNKYIITQAHLADAVEIAWTCNHWHSVRSQLDGILNLLIAIEGVSDTYRELQSDALLLWKVALQMESEVASK